MTLKAVSSDILLQLAEVVSGLTPTEYTQPLGVLSYNSIGKHVRHILEFYDLLLQSLAVGHLNYDHRHRDLTLETDPDEALRRLGLIDRAVQRLDLSLPLRLEANLSAAGTFSVTIASSVERELLYNIEHGIHHMALIQVGMRAEFGHLPLPDHFGVAYSTVQHQQQTTA
jgi:uncharacterized damage-inducible protein DinB